MYSSISRPGPAKHLAPELESARHLGWRGGFIAPHRAFVRLRLGPGRIVRTVALATTGVAGWIAVLPAVGRIWGHMFRFWGKELGLNSEVLLVPQGWGSHIHFALPCFEIAAGPASGIAWWSTTAVTLLAFIASFLLNDEALPWKYLLRSFCLLQVTAVGYFAIASARFPHDLPGYTVSMLVFSSILIGLVPVLYAFTFYILNFSLMQNVFLTVVTMLHLIVFVPHQYILHAYLLHASVLLMPVLYFIFGPLLDVLAFIGFYAWGMSWSGSEPFEI